MRKNTTRMLAIVLVLACACTTLWAVSNPVIQGLVGGIELCPQFICGAAIFVGEFRGTLGNNPFARGIITAAMIHESPLPPANLDVDILGGSWEIKTLLRRVQGRVVTGTIHNNNDDGTFTISAELELAPAGSGQKVYFQGQLNHNTLIPTWGGVLLQ